MSRIRVVRNGKHFGRARQRPRHLPGGRISLRQRKWDRAHGHKQKQVKCASDEMRFDGRINLFFHFGVVLFDFVPELRITFWSGLPFYFGAPGNVNTFSNNFSADYIISEF